MVGAIFVVRTLWREWDQITQALQDAQPWWLLAAFALGAAAMLGIALVWHRALEITAGAPGLRESLRWYFVGELGKYVPGGVWAVVGRAEMAARAGRSRSHAYGSVLLALAATYLCGIGLTVGLLIGDAPDLLGPLQVMGLVGLLVAGALALHPRVLRRVLSLASRGAMDSAEVVIPSWRGALGLVVANLPSWLCMGLATWCVARGLGLTPPILEIMLATSLSWVLGFLVVPAPGGLGVREAAFVLASVSLSGGSAAAIAVVARGVFILVDGLGAAVLSLLILLDRWRCNA